MPYNFGVTKLRRNSVKANSLLYRVLGNPKRNDQFGYAVVGLGHIAAYFLDQVRASPSLYISAVVSGDAAKAAIAARQYHATAYTYDNFDQIASNAAIDAVYLALPVSMHREYTVRAAAAGKHVLCEKPMAPSSTDAQAMIDACRSAGVTLSLAYRCPHDPTHQAAQALVRAGALGRTLTIESGYGFELKPGWRTNVALAGGGSLYDVGIYPLNATRYLLGEEPSGVEDASATCTPDGLEQRIAWTSIFPSGARAVCRSSYVENIPDTLRISGGNGFLSLNPAFTHRGRLHLTGEYRDASGRTVQIDQRSPAKASHFRLEAEHLAAVVCEKIPLLTPGEDGLADMLAMEQIYRAAGVPQPAALR